MEIKQNIADALNAQIGLEFEASIKYESIYAFFTNEELPQLAGFFAKQATEEREHAHRIIKFLLDRDAQVKIPAIAAPPHSFASHYAAVECALKSEQRVTKSLTDLYELALEERDHPTSIMLQWFITEQVEEEATVRQLLKFVERGKESGMLTLEDYIAEVSGPSKE